MHYIDNGKVINPKRHLNHSKLPLNLKGSTKLGDLYINSIKKMYSTWYPHKQGRSFCDKDLTVIRSKLTDDKIDYVLEKDNSRIREKDKGKR